MSNSQNLPEDDYFIFTGETLKRKKRDSNTMEYRPKRLHQFDDYDDDNDYFYTDREPVNKRVLLIGLLSAMTLVVVIAITVLIFNFVNKPVPLLEKTDSTPKITQMMPTEPHTTTTPSKLVNSVYNYPMDGIAEINGVEYPVFQYGMFLSLMSAKESFDKVNIIDSDTYIVTDHEGANAVVFTNLTTQVAKIEAALPTTIILSEITTATQMPEPTPVQEVSEPEQTTTQTQQTAEISFISQTIITTPTTPTNAIQPVEPEPEIPTQLGNQ
ncbi:MAG: hypothetical protein ACOX2M_03585 [Fastidiosipilaceae bacterium]|jgi:hypothetical protein